jgi:hypothetical protein
MNKQIEVRHPIPSPPIHPLAALITVVLDNVFGVVEIVTPVFIVLTSLGLFAVGAVATTFIQRFLARESWGISLAKGLAMGIIAGVPFPVTGTVFGAPLLVWAGLHRWVKRPASNVELSENDIDVIDGNYRKK